MGILACLAALLLGTAAGQVGYRLDTVAGGDNVGDGGPARFAQFIYLNGVAVDKAGNVYVSDTDHHRVRRISPAGLVTTIAGTGHAGFSGDGKPAPLAQINFPYGLAVDDIGNVYVADYGNNRVRRITLLDGTITTVAGTGRKASGGDGGPAAAASLMGPRNLALDATGLYISEFQGHRVRRIGPDGRIQTVAGTGQAGKSGDLDPGPATSAQLAFPAGLAVFSGTLYIVDSGNLLVRRVDSDGSIHTVLGGTSGIQLEGLGFLSPVAVAVDRSGVVYVGHGASVVLSFTPGGWWSYFAGGYPGYAGDGGPARQALLSGISDLAFDGQGNLFIADGPRLRRVNTSHIITTVAGDNYTTAVVDNGPATAGILNRPTAVALDQAGNLFIADTGTQRIRKVTPSGIIATAAGSGQVTPPGPITATAGSGQAVCLGVATAAALAADMNAPSGVAVDPLSGVLFADRDNNRVRRIDPDNRVRTAAGSGCQGLGALGLTPDQTMMRQPRGVCATTDAFYVVDTENHRLLRVPRAGTVSAVAGNGSPGNAGDTGPAPFAQLSSPRACTVDFVGNIYIADTGNCAIRKVSATGVITTVAGTGGAGFIGDEGPATSARLLWPSGVAVDGQGTLYISDTGNHRIRAVDSQGVIHTIAGTGTQGYAGDGGPALDAQLDSPGGIALDGSGNLFAADTGNDRVRKLTPVITPPAPPVVQPGLTLVNAASRRAGPVAPGQLAIVQGGALGPAIPAAGRVDANGILETSVGGCEVRFDAAPAPLLSVTWAEILLQVPYAVSGQARTEIDVRCAGTSVGTLSVSVVDAAPALFSTVLHEDGALNSESSPVARGAVVTFQATGEGLPDAAAVTGKPAQAPFTHPALPVTLSIAGINAEILYAGAAPGQIGVLQINARVPAGFVPPGKADVLLCVGSAVSVPVPIYLR